ncbi:glycosyltransferase [Pelagicoccus albus]|uniref:Glycosyltransferase family 2 protein n=1 Tax=Pelagicoccus albus TaxID=415222 RepID=A0A7X1E902_9BACT|nr:glycosyltransferase family 2 protein [Pelagicoccus albus]MBC2606678.1 glycosyltransferase family 2 protein [Pelagicoccus albus]
MNTREARFGTDICFVILHYQVMEETEACVRSIREKVDTEHYAIVIVDNASPNGSGDRLKKLYRRRKRVTVLQSEKNLGFARGNNLGYDYAKNELNARFIVMLNNDTLMIQDDFLSVIEREYQKYDFAVLGPRIETNDDSPNCNPGPSTFSSTEWLDRVCRLNRKHLWRHYFRVEKLLPALKRKLMQVIKPAPEADPFEASSTQTPVKEMSEDAHRENVQLHGCCLIFSPLFTERFDGLDPRTFMFMEEEILFVQVRRSGLKTLYSPDVEILHLEDAATDAIYDKPRDKRIFYLRNQLRSAQVLRQVLRETNSA